MKKDGSPMKNHLLRIYIPIFLLFISGGCAKLALRLSPSLVADFKDAIFEECDPEMARNAIPAHIKILEGLLKSDPQNRHVLLALCQGLSGYSMLFVENEAPERASRLYLRARDIGIKALGKKGVPLRNVGAFAKDIDHVLMSFSEDDMETLFWITLSWSAWANLNLDQPAAIAHLPVLDACVQRITELNGDYMYGLPRVLMGTTLAARPSLFGGDLKRAGDLFERALAFSRGRFFLVQYYYAKYYAVGIQDKGLFLKLIHDIIEGDPGSLKDVCLINAVIQTRAKELKARADELFF